MKEVSKIKVEGNGDIVDVALITDRIKNQSTYLHEFGNRKHQKFYPLCLKDIQKKENDCNFEYTCLCMCELHRID